MNTDQKLPAESAGERPSTPLFGHAISHEATLIGLFAIVLWGFMAGLVRLVSESFGATLGSALIYTVGGMLLLIVRRRNRLAKRHASTSRRRTHVHRIRDVDLAVDRSGHNERAICGSQPRQLFVADAAGTDDRRRVAQTRLGLRSAAGCNRSHRRRGNGVGGENLDVQEAVANIASNPLPYALAFAGAFIWAIYATVTPSMSDGYDGTTIFFCCVAVVLWIIHFVSGDGLPAVAPGIGGYIALLACAASIAGGYACWGYGMLHGSMETLAIGSYATPLFSTASSTLLLGVTLGMPFWIGVALVVVGSLINVWFARRR